MDILKGYINSISGFVTSVIDEPTASEVASPGDVKVGQINELEQSNIKIESSSTDSDHPTDGAVGESGGLFDWIANGKVPIGENPLVYCINSLASLGSDEATQPSEEVLTTQQDVIRQDVADIPPPIVLPSEQPGSERSQESSTEVFSNWVEGLSSRTEEVWKQMKQDFTEVVTVLSHEPREAVARTASVVRLHLSAAANAAKKIDPSQLSLLPETRSTAEDEADSQSAPPPLATPEFPSLSTIRSDVTELFNGVLSTLFGTDEASATPVETKREARLQIIRADPATYAQEPPTPPPYLGVHSYAEWRAAYFDEHKCQPLPGVPICDVRNPENVIDNVEELLEPTHLSPEELLEKHPFMRTYLSQLVRIDGQADDGGITDADFWSRYYYRVWLLDVTERRRQQLAERVQSSGPATNPDTMLSDRDSHDWLVDSDVDTANLSTPSAAHSSGAQSPVKPDISCSISVESPILETSTGPCTVERPVASSKPHGAVKQRKPRRKKRNNSHRVGRSPDSVDSDQPNGHDSEEPFQKSHVFDIPDSAEFQGRSNESSQQEPVQVLEEVAGLLAPRAAESEETVTSGSSSVVVVGNSDEDPDIGTGFGLHHSVTNRTVHMHVPDSASPISDACETNSDDWGEVSHPDLAEFHIERPANSSSSADRPNPTADDWDDWS